VVIALPYRRHPTTSQTPQEAAREPGDAADHGIDPRLGTPGCRDQRSVSWHRWSNASVLVLIENMSF